MFGRQRAFLGTDRLNACVGYVRPGGRREGFELCCGVDEGKVGSRSFNELGALMCTGCGPESRYRKQKNSVGRVCLYGIARC